MQASNKISFLVIRVVLGMLRNILTVCMEENGDKPITYSDLRYLVNISDKFVEEKMRKE